ncbi:hypothetical protein M426DRAFT_20012 [Hypoxylon sp. CI-4A]|nr:hypothetical protein M426DRAFT_20012 [Hypoxylon sp. CI-4A]
MTSRHRPTTRSIASAEPAGEPLVRQTRSAIRRNGSPLEPESLSQVTTPQRTTRSRRDQSVIIKGPPPDSPDHASPQLKDISLAPVPESERSQNGAASDTDNALDLPEVQAARIQDMMDFDIPKLIRWITKTVELLEAVEDNKPSVKERALLGSYKKSFNHARIPFADGDALFVNPVDLPENTDPEVRTKIQVAVSSANIVSLLAAIVDVMIGNIEPLPVLQQLDSAFPVMFNPGSLTRGDEEDDDDAKGTLYLAFHVRKRHLAELLASEPDDNPFELAASVFCSHLDRRLSNSQDVLMNGEYKQLAGASVDQDENFYEDFRTFMTELISKLSCEGSTEVHAYLNHICPQDRIFRDIRSWALDTYRWFNTTTKLTATQAAGPAAESRPRTGREGSEPLFVDNNGAVREDDDSASDTDDGEYDQLPSQESNRNFITDNSTLTAVRLAEQGTGTLSAVAPPSNQQAIESKAKAIDARDAIQRLDPNQILDRTRKRPRSSGDSSNDENGDDDFEVNEQLLDDSRRARRGEATARGPTPKRPRLSRQPLNDSPLAMSPSVGGMPAIASRRLLSDGLDANLQDQDIMNLSQNARNVRRAAYANKPRQARVPWSASDTKVLLSLIADPSLGCSWSAMEKKGGFESTRSQQAIRDKARGLKVWYLESDKILPPGFDQVALGKKEKEAVINCGKNPYRREEDIDDEDQVTNNIWVEDD